MRWDGAGRGWEGTKPRPCPAAPPFAPAVGLQVPAESIHLGSKVGVWPVFSGYKAQRVEPKCFKWLGKELGSGGRDQQARPRGF